LLSCLHIGLALLASATVVAATSEAQIAPPLTPTGGMFGEREPADPNRESKTLSVVIDVGGGYDQNLEADSGIALPPGTYGPLQSGSVAAGQLTTLYRWGRATQFVEASAHGYASYASAGIDQLTGGDASARAEKELGPRMGVSLQGNATYQPAFLFNAFGPILGEIEGGVPGATPLQGITEQRFLSLQATGGIYRKWTSRQRTDVGYGGSRQRPLSGPGLDNRVRTTSVIHEWLATRSVGFRAAYEFSDNTQQFAVAGEQAVTSHGYRAGIQLRRRLSSSRSVVFGFGGGAIHSTTSLAADDGTNTFAVPSAYLSARVDLARSWELASEVNRDVSILAGLNPEPFRMTAMSVRLNGALARRVQVSLTGAYATGASFITRSGAFDNAAATAQTQFALSRSTALFVSYNYYYHRLIDVRVLQPGFPARYARNAIRLGLSVWMPVLGIR
jgi:hypothetical protein